MIKRIDGTERVTLGYSVASTLTKRLTFLMGLTDYSGNGEVNKEEGFSVLVSES